jgi:hypothetical protein
MADYSLLLNGDDFERRYRPALADAWRCKSFGPCACIAAHLAPAARDYAARYHTGDQPPLVALVAGGLQFDRATWRGLVGEILLFAAEEIPEFQTCEDTLCRLVADRDLIRQAHHGSRDLTFGPAVYRPDCAGYNAAADVARLADDLAGIPMDRWTTAELTGDDQDDVADQLAFAREWFPVLADLFLRAHERGQVVVHERIF